MPRHCETLRIMPDGTFAILCTSRGGRAPRCGCGKPSAKQCDYPVGKRGRTCSKHLCSSCAVTAGNVTRIEAVSPADIAADPDVLGVAIRKGLVPRREAVEDTVDYCPAHARKLEEERQAELAARLAPSAAAVPVSTRIEPEQLELGGL